MLTKAEKEKREKALEKKAIERKIKKEKKEQLLEIALEERNKLLEFTEKYLEPDNFISSRRLAIAFEGTVMREQPTKRLACQFGQILRSFKGKGVLEKYNNQQYRVIK